MSLQEIVVMIHNGEYGRAISSLETEAADERKLPAERAECCRWLAECNKRLEDYKSSGDWYLEAVKMILMEPADQKTKAEQALPMCEKALECFKQDGDASDVMVAARLKQYLLGLRKRN